MKEPVRVGIEIWVTSFKFYAIFLQLLLYMTSSFVCFVGPTLNTIRSLVNHYFHAKFEYFGLTVTNLLNFENLLALLFFMFIIISKNYENNFYCPKKKNEKWLGKDPTAFPRASADKDRGLYGRPNLTYVGP